MERQNPIEEKNSDMRILPGFFRVHDTVNNEDATVLYVYPSTVMTLATAWVLVVWDDKTLHLQTLNNLTALIA